MLSSVLAVAEARRVNISRMDAHDEALPARPIMDDLPYNPLLAVADAKSEATA